MTALITATLLLAGATAARATSPNLKNRTSQAIVSTWNCQDHLGVHRTPARSPWKHHSQGFRRAELQRWQQRLNSCRKVLHERARQWHWESWLPDKWVRIARCETGIDFHFSNSQYVSAFGIARSSWAAFRPANVPAVPEQASPWEQWQVALAIWRAFGYSGWGCRNA